jgi:hypothetical protein
VESAERTAAAVDVRDDGQTELGGVRTRADDAHLRCYRGERTRNTRHEGLRAQTQARLVPAHPARRAARKNEPFAREHK